MTVVPGLIDCHDHLASHGYDLVTRWGLDERASTRHLRTAHAIERTLAMGDTAVRDAGGHGHPPNAAELEHLVAAGLSPMQAIQAATAWAADCLGLPGELGTVEKGKRADLVVVEGDPLADIRILQDPLRIRCVIKDGRVEVGRD